MLEFSAAARAACLVVLCVILAVAAGCHDDDCVGRWGLGVIDLGHGVEKSLLVVPDSARAGESFTVEVTTWGLSGCVEPGPVDTETPEPGLVELRPYDGRCVARAEPCDQGIHPLRHSVRVVLRPAGVGRVRLIGRGFTASGMDTAAIEKTVVLW